MIINIYINRRQIRLNFSPEHKNNEIGNQITIINISPVSQFSLLTYYYYYIIIGIVFQERVRNICLYKVLKFDDTQKLFTHFVHFP